jgi:limonene-1,2-epoxide hydrolase
VISTEELVGVFLDAVEAQDLDAVLGCFATEATWQNVPHPPARGLEEIRAVLKPILTRSSRVRWDIVTAAYHDDRAWLERVDRFWIDGREYSARCNGVIEREPGTGLILAFRDYVDLGEWRARLGEIDL